MFKKTKAKILYLIVGFLFPKEWKKYRNKSTVIAPHETAMITTARGGILVENKSGGAVMLTPYE